MRITFGITPQGVISCVSRGGGPWGATNTSLSIVKFFNNLARHSSLVVNYTLLLQLVRNQFSCGPKFKVYGEPFVSIFDPYFFIR